MAYRSIKRGAAWRLMLLPVFALGVLQTERLSALFTRALDGAYAGNWIMLGACALGLLLALVAGARKRALIGAALILWLSPLWLRTAEAAGAVRGFQEGGILPMLISAPAALWGLMPVRAGRGREWPKGVMAFLLAARTAALLITRSGGVIWISELLLVTSAVALGTLIDAAYTGFSLSALAALAAGGGYLIAWRLDADILASATFLWCALGVMAITAALIIAFEKRRSKWARALTLAGVAICVLALIITGEI